MKINDRWAVESGGDCFVVVETRNGKNPKTGEPTTTQSRTYHPSMARCAKKIAQSETLLVLEMDALSEVVERVERATNQLVSAMERSA
jgi:hypothetical protein